MNIKDRINQAGKVGSYERLIFISNLQPTEYPQESINAAKRCLYKRGRRLELKEKTTLTHDQINTIIEAEILQNKHK